MATKLPMSVDKWFALPQSDSVASVVLAAGATTTIDVPGGARFVAMSGTADYWYQEGTSLTIPAATAGAGAKPELNPYFRKLSTNLRKITIGAGDSALSMSLSFFS